jgi:Sulfotransferase family
VRTADLICIGSQKAATTWLHRMLARHPDVFSPVMKELHYFDILHVDIQRNFQIRRRMRARRLLHEHFERTTAHRFAAFMLTEVLRHRTLRRYLAELRFTAALPDGTPDDRWYASLFEGARPGQVACDFTTAYALLPSDGIAHMRKLCPEARVILILRDPVERAISHARMVAERARAPRTAAALREALDSWAVRSRDDVIDVLDRWQARWPSEQFKVLFFDDIGSRPLDALADVCRFAGLRFNPGIFRNAHRAVHRGPSYPVDSGTLDMLRQRFAPALDELARRYPRPAANWARARIAGGGETGGRTNSRAQVAEVPAP